jgi:hypothetical protein
MMTHGCLLYKTDADTYVLTLYYTLTNGHGWPWHVSCLEAVCLPLMD